MSLAMTMDTTPEGTVCKSFDAGTVQEISLYNQAAGIDMDFTHGEFKEIVKAFLTGEDDWHFGDTEQYSCSVRPHRHDSRYALEVMKLSKQPERVLIGPDDFWCIVEYWLTNTQLSRHEDDPRLGFMEEIETIQPAEYAKPLYYMILSMEIEGAIGQQRFSRRKI